MLYLRTLLVVCTVSCDVSRDPGVIVSVRGFSLAVCYIRKWKRLSCPMRLRERVRAPDPRERIRLCRCPRSVGRALRAPRTPTTLQLVAGTGWKHPARHSLYPLYPLLLSMAAWPLAQLGVRPPVIGRAFASDSAAWPGTSAKEKERSSLALLTNPVQNTTWPGLW